MRSNKSSGLVLCTYTMSGKHKSLAALDSESGDYGLRRWWISSDFNALKAKKPGPIGLQLNLLAQHARRPE